MILSNLHILPVPLQYTQLIVGVECSGAADVPYVDTLIVMDPDPAHTRQLSVSERSGQRSAALNAAFLAARKAVKEDIFGRKKVLRVKGNNQHKEISLFNFFLSLR